MKMEWREREREKEKKKCFYCNRNIKIFLPSCDTVLCALLCTIHTFIHSYTSSSFLQFRFKYIASKDNFRRTNRLLNITIVVNDALCLILTY